MSITLLQYFANTAADIGARAFSGVRSLRDWEERRGELRQCFFDSLGLRGFSASADPDVSEHGSVRGDGYVATKLSFRIIPDCRGSGMLFSPSPLPARKNPGVLYLCGHSNFGIPQYHPHAIMWARRGYVCLILDTIRQTDNTGEHAGLSMHGREDWISMGYAAAGGELLNSLAGLNVLCSLPDVDVERVGATGLSGGGAHCFFLAIADERVRAVASTCGVVNLKYTVRNRHYNSNCDCMFWYNLHRKDTAEYGALIAPRPLLFAHANGDYLFSPEENRDLHRNIGRIYELYGCPEKCALFQFDGPHSYQPSSVKAINDWFDLHLAGQPMPEGALGKQELDERQCTIWNGDIPVPDRLDILPELLSPPRSFPIPDTLEGLSALRKEVVPELERRVFPYVVGSEERLGIQLIHEWRLDPILPHPVMRKYRGAMGGMELWITHHVPAPNLKNLVVYICDVDEDDLRALSSLPVSTADLEILTVEPRAGGLNAYNPNWRVNLLRAGLHVGITPITLWMKDLREVLAHFTASGDFSGKNVYLYGARDAGIAALYTAVLDESIRGVIIKDIPRSHRAGGHILNILKVLDVEQALGLLAPRIIGLDTHEWEFVFWSARLYQRLGIWDRFVHTPSMAHTLRRIFPG